MARVWGWACRSFLLAVTCHITGLAGGRRISTVVRGEKHLGLNQHGNILDRVCGIYISFHDEFWWCISVAVIDNTAFFPEPIQRCFAFRNRRALRMMSLFLFLPGFEGFTPARVKAPDMSCRKPAVPSGEEECSGAETRRWRLARIHNRGILKYEVRGDNDDGRERSCLHAATQPVLGISSYTHPMVGTRAISCAWQAYRLEILRIEDASHHLARRPAGRIIRRVRQA